MSLSLPEYIIPYPHIISTVIIIVIIIIIFHINGDTLEFIHSGLILQKIGENKINCMKHQKI